jgi:hypothetical protein
MRGAFVDQGGLFSAASKMIGTCTSRNALMPMSQTSTATTDRSDDDRDPR